MGINTPRPSAAHRWLACPGSLTLAADDDGASAAAARGTRLHEIAATWLKMELDGNSAPHALIAELDLDEERALTHYVKSVLDQVRVAVAPAALRIEEPVTWLPGLTGTADAVVMGREVQIHDLKFHAGKFVNVVENPQLSCYALGLRERSHAASDVGVRLFIHQGARTQEWFASAAYLDAFEDRVRAALAAAAQPSPPFAPSIDTCRYCPALASCAHAARKVEAATIHSPTLPATGVEQGRLQRLAELARIWADAVTAASMRRLTVGEPVDGYKLVRGRAGARQWAAESEVIATLKKARVPVDTIYNRDLKSPTQLQKAVEEKVWDRVAEFVSQPEGKPTLAPANDPRPALEMIKFDEPETQTAKSIEDFL